MKPPVVVIRRHCNGNQYGIAVRFKKMQSVAKIAQSSASSPLRRRGQRRQTWADARVETYRRRANSIHRQCQRDVTSQHQATGAKHLESVLAIVCVIERSKRNRRGPSSTGVQRAVPWARYRRRARDSRHHPGLEWPKRAAPPRPPRNKGRSAHAPAPLAAGPISRRRSPSPSGLPPVPRERRVRILRVHRTPKACIFCRALPPFGHGAGIAYA
jgi:hypothetical protein